MGLEFIKENITTLAESIRNYEAAVKAKGENSEDAKALKKFIVELCSSFKADIAEARKNALKDAE